DRRRAGVGDLLVLPDAESLPPVAQDSRCGHLGRNVLAQRRLCALVQRETQLHGARLRGTLLLGARPKQRPPAESGVLHPFESGTSWALPDGRRLALEQLPGDRRASKDELAQHWLAARTVRDGSCVRGDREWA